MDFATYLQNKKSLKSPVVQVDRLSPLSDPERPVHVAPAEIGRSLFQHLSTSLLGEGREQAETWNALVGEARRVRREQQAEDRVAAPTQPEDMTIQTVEALVVATTRRDALFELVDAATPVSDRADARRRAEVAAVDNAFRAKGEPNQVVFDGGDVARAYGDSVKALGRIAKADARVKNVEIKELNHNAGENEMTPLVDPKKLTTGWLRSMEAPTAMRGARWTDNHIVVAKTNEEAAVLDGFLKLALTAVDRNATPSRDELRDGVAKLRNELAQPVVITKSERLRMGGPNETERMGKVGVRAVMVRPPITARTAEFRRSVNVPLGTSVEEGANRLRQAKQPLVGVEGQDWYAETAVVTEALRRMKRGRGYQPTFISHAPEGTAFRKTLELAAKAAKVDVIYGSVELSKVNSVAVSEETRTHADGVYASEARRTREVRTLTTIPDANATGDGGPEGRRNRVGFDEGTARYQARGKLVIFDVVAKGEGISDMQVVNTRTNHAALTPSRMVAFGVERYTPELPRILKRRQRSGRSQAYVLDKAGRRVPTLQVNAKIDQLAQTYTEKQREGVNDTRGWRLDRPAGMLLATATVGAARATQLSEFKTVGAAMEAATRSLADPKSGREVAKEYGVSTGALMAAVQFEGKSRDAIEFQNKAASALARVRNVREEDGTSLLVDPRDAMVARQGPMVGFSAEKARDAAKGSRVSIVGDEGDVSPALAGNIDKLVAGLAEKYGRDADGVAKARVTTTLTTGVGEAVMDAAMRHKVPFEAIGHKDDRGFKRGSDDMRLFSKAWAAHEAGLGGTWSLHTYGEREQARTSTMAAQVAMVGSDAVVVPRVRANDALAVAVASVGADKPVLTLAPSDPNPLAYSGNVLLATPGATIAATWLTKNGTPLRFTENAHVTEGVDRSRGDARVLSHATVDVGAGATEMKSVDAVGLVRQAALGEMDLRMGRSKASPSDERVRWERIEGIDLDRVGERQYVEKLGLSQREADLVGRMSLEHRASEASRVFSQSPELNARELLSERFRVAPERAAKRERASEGMGL